MDFNAALKGVREARSCIELLAKLQGQLQTQQEININFNLEYVMEKIIHVIRGEIRDPQKLNRISDKLFSLSEEAKQ